MLKFIMDLTWFGALFYFGLWAALKLVVHYQSLDPLYIVGVAVGILGVDSLRAISLLITRIFNPLKRKD